MSDQGFGEMFQRGFARDDHVAFMQAAFDLYGHRCAVTGQVFRASKTAVHPDLTVFLFQPMQHGGVLAPANGIVVDLGAASLLAKGILMIDDDYRTFLARPEFLDTASEGATPNGKPLFLPDDAAFWPTRYALAYHRSLFRTH